MSAFILGVSIVISAFIIKDTFSNKTSSGVSKQTVTLNSIPELMTKKQLSQYLQLSEKSIDSIISSDNFKKKEMETSGVSSYDFYQFLPYLKVGNQERFLKTEIDKWLKYKNDHRYS
jgi:predicted DNA-binding transcriptional regulator AlpA